MQSLLPLHSEILLRYSARALELSRNNGNDLLGNGKCSKLHRVCTGVLLPHLIHEWTERIFRCKVLHPENALEKYRDMTCQKTKGALNWNSSSCRFSRIIRRGWTHGEIRLLKTRSGSSDGCAGCFNNQKGWDAD